MLLSFSAALIWGKLLSLHPNLTSVFLDTSLGAEEVQTYRFFLCSWGKPSLMCAEHQQSKCYFAFNCRTSNVICRLNMAIFSRQRRPSRLTSTTSSRQSGTSSPTRLPRWSLAPNLCLRSPNAGSKFYVSELLKSSHCG